MKTLQELFIKYLNNQCSPEEIKQLLEHFDVQENEAVLKRLIVDSLENTDADDEVSQWDPAVNQSFSAIKKRMTQGQVKTVPLYRQSWFRIAAIVVVLAGGFAAYSLLNSNNPETEIAIVDTGENQINAGSNKAVLTLADGSTIVLQDAANGTVAHQGTTRLEKTGNNLLTYTPSNEKPEKDLLNSIATPRGGQYQVVLADGSKVWLNATSTLRFPAHFTGSERRVELSGEAYFEVAKDMTMPFKVAVAGKKEVEVLGTHFNITAYADEPVVKTTLLEGKVKIIAHASTKPQILYPGEEAQVTGNGEISIDKNADTEKAIAWQKGHFSFSNADLTTILRQLSRWYDVDIKFEGPVPDRRFTGEIQRDLKLPQVLTLLDRNNVSFRLEGKTLVVLR